MGENETGLQQGHHSEIGHLRWGWIQENKGEEQKGWQENTWKTRVGLLPLVSQSETLSWNGREGNPHSFKEEI